MFFDEFNTIEFLKNQMDLNELVNFKYESNIYEE